MLSLLEPRALGQVIAMTPNSKLLEIHVHCTGPCLLLGAIILNWRCQSFEIIAHRSTDLSPGRRMMDACIVVQPSLLGCFRQVDVFQNS